MKFPISSPILAFLLFLPTAAPLTAGQPSPAGRESGVQASDIVPAAFGDGPPTGSHRTRRSHSAGAPKTEPFHADMNGATREGADKTYRKQYGF